MFHQTTGKCRLAILNLQNITIRQKTVEARRSRQLVLLTQTIKKDELMRIQSKKLGNMLRSQDLTLQPIPQTPRGGLSIWLNHALHRHITSHLHSTIMGHHRNRCASHPKIRLNVGCLITQSRLRYLTKRLGVMGHLKDSTQRIHINIHLMEDENLVRASLRYWVKKEDDQVLGQDPDRDLGVARRGEAHL
jgi:hypothetical protein